LSASQRFLIEEVIMARLRWVQTLGIGYALLLGAGTLPLQAQSPPPIKFEVPAVVDPIHTNGEPDIGIDPQGRVFVSGPTGTGTQRSVWLGSVDRGHTFRIISPVQPNAIAGLTDPPGGGDTDINFDRSGKQYFADLYALTCLRTATTTDGGATVSQETYPAGCAFIPGADRQWLAVYDPEPGTPNQSAYTGPKPLIYLEYNNVVSGAQWNKSNSDVDAVPGGPGLTYVAATKGTTSPCPANLGFYAPFGADGYPAIDQVTGKVMQASGSQNSDSSFNLLLNIGTPDASGDLTFLDFPNTANPCGDSSKLIHIADNLPGSPSTLFTVLSMDSARNLFIAWALSPNSGSPALRQVFVSASSAANGWTNWSAPVQVSDGSTVTGDAVNIFPWIKAGGAGRADAVWYGSNVSADPSNASGQVWNVFMAQVVYATDATGTVRGAAPSVTLMKVSPHPMHYNDVCLAGTGCIAQQGNRNLADFFAVTIDHTGAAEIVYDDTSNGLAQAGFTPTGNQTVDHAGAGVITVARQSSGPGLFGANVFGPSNAPTTGISDNFGDALYPVIGGTNVPGMDILSNSIGLSGNTLTVTTRIVDLTNPAATAARITGTSFLQYVTRWQMGNTIYYAAMENTALNNPIFFAGKAQSVDLCSVSACFPHVITYPEPPPVSGSGGPGFTGSMESGSINCPSAPSANNPCTLTINVKVADVDNPTSSSLLEEVGSYSFASLHQSGAIMNPQAEADEVPLEVDGACCYNTLPQPPQPPPCRIADGNGDEPGNKGGSAHFSFHEDDCNLQPGNEDFSDPNSGTDFQSTQVNSVAYDDVAHTVTIAGLGTNNGFPVAFTIVAVDSSLVASGMFSITLSDGYTNSGHLLDGSITLR
jgi:hypothetical protein